MVLFEGKRQSLTNAAAREINDILQNLPGWRSKGNKLRFGRYFGAQQAFVREPRSWLKVYPISPSVANSLDFIYRNNLILI